MEEDLNLKIQELQTIEQNSQQFLMQKQSLQLELSEAENALRELSGYSGDTYRILGGILMKVDREKIIKELEEKKKVLELRVGSIEKQERIVEDKVSKLRNDIQEHLKSSK